MALAIAATLYLAAYGARTPLLALRGLARLRNIALVILPAAAMALLVVALRAFGGDVSEGATLVAIVPAPLVAPSLVARIGRRGDLAGALALGTLLLSVVALGARGAPATTPLFTALEAFAIAAMLAGALPTIRDALLRPLHWAGWAAAAAIVILALLEGPPLDALTFGVAVLLIAAGAGTAALVARLERRDVLAAVYGAGLRDPFLAIALASTVGAPAGIPLVYAALCLAFGALSLRSGSLGT